MASPEQVQALKNAIITRAEAEGSVGSKLGLGDPTEYFNLGEHYGEPRLGIQKKGQSLEIGKTFDIVAKGIADWVSLFFDEVDPVGTIKMLYGGAGIPTGWAVCDGTDGTPDLRDRFILGGTTSGETGGSTTTGPANPEVSGPAGDYTTALGGPSTVATDDHTHSIAHTHSHTPPFYRLIFIMKVGV